jgi:hypothetical protein
MAPTKELSSMRKLSISIQGILLKEILPAKYSTPPNMQHTKNVSTSRGAVVLENIFNVNHFSSGPPPSSILNEHSSDNMAITYM